MKQGLTLTELAAELQRQNDVKVDYLAPTNQIHFVTAPPSEHLEGVAPGGSEIDLLGTEAQGLRVNDIAHQQIGTRLGIPRGYYSRLQAELPQLLDQNVNRLLRHNPKDGAYPKWMVRTLDGTARAVLSDAYRRLDNHEIATAVFPILGDLPGCQVRSMALTDKHIHLKAVTSIEGEISGSRQVGDVVRAGVYIGNSEVGYGSVVVYPFIERLVCTNGMTVQTDSEAGMMRRVHLGRRVNADGVGRVFRDETLKQDDRAFMMALGDVVRAAVDETRFRELVETMSLATEGQRVTNVAAAVEMLAKNEGLSDREASSVLQHLAEGGDLSRWGVLNAVTQTAETVESYDRATELEALGGKILGYKPHEWSRVALAVA